MKQIDDLDTIQSPFPQAVITIGNFDGVHIGHQALFYQTIEKAQAINGTAVAMTFEPHPAKVLGHLEAPPLITLHEQKIELISRTGIDVLISVPFTKAFADLSAEMFVVDLLVGKLGMKAIVVGEDYSYGSRRKGNLTSLRTDAKRFGFEVVLVPGVQFVAPEKGRISSTRIRELVMDGNVSEAQKLLGRYYQVRGEVVTGRNRGGKLLGFPTANINLQDELCPKMGVYAVTVECVGGKFKGVANIGYSPTFDDHIYTIEVHILDFDKPIYGEKIRVNFIRWIRDEMKFSDLPQLSNQITKDILQVRDLLSL
jgi:riboflavin kinase / FMN adenylyltransferase